MNNKSGFWVRVTQSSVKFSFWVSVSVLITQIGFFLIGEQFQNFSTMVCAAFFLAILLNRLKVSMNVLEIIYQDGKNTKVGALLFGIGFALGCSVVALMLPIDTRLFAFKFLIGVSGLTLPMGVLWATIYELRGGDVLNYDTSE